MLNLKKNYSKIILNDSLKRSNDSLAVLYFNKSLRSDPDDEILIAKNYMILVNLKLIFLLALRLDGSVKVKSQKKKIFLKMMYLNFRMALLI